MTNLLWSTGGSSTGGTVQATLVGPDGKLKRSCDSKCIILKCDLMN